ncbi:hypothetical protein WJX79_004057 [Trebouxia sp. C0005]
MVPAKRQGLQNTIRSLPPGIQVRRRLQQSVVAKKRAVQTMCLLLFRKHSLSSLGNYCLSWRFCCIQLQQSWCGLLAVRSSSGDARASYLQAKKKAHLRAVLL